MNGATLLPVVHRDSGAKGTGSFAEASAWDRAASRADNAVDYDSGTALPTYRNETGSRAEKEMRKLQRRRRLPYPGRTEKQTRTKRLRGGRQSELTALEHRADAGNDMVLPLDPGKQLGFEAVHCCGKREVFGQDPGLRALIPVRWMS